MFGRHSPQGNIFDFSKYESKIKPRTVFKRTSTHKTTFNERQLIPIYVDEVIPGDTHSMDYSHLIRLTTPINPIMDNMYINTAFFFVPMRQLWKNFTRFLGEQKRPEDSTDFIIPSSPLTWGGYMGCKPYTIGDYMGLPNRHTLGDVDNSDKKWHNVNVLPFRAYKKVYGEWFADQNLENYPVYNDVKLDCFYDGDGDDTQDRIFGLNLMPFITNAKHNYFTSALPFLQKGQPVRLPMAGQAPVYTADISQNTGVQFTTVVGANMQHGTLMYDGQKINMSSGGQLQPGYPLKIGDPSNPERSNLIADLQQATGISINDFRLLATTQQYLELNARGGTRYNEYLLSHFGTHNGDLTLQRTQLLCISKDTLNITPLASTMNDPNGRPLGDLGAVGYGYGSKRFSNTFNEWGYLIGLCWIDAEQTYEQGINAMWSRKIAFDLPDPIFANLGEQPIFNKELYYEPIDKNHYPEPDPNEEAFGYTERYNEMRYKPSINTAQMRVADPLTLSSWHLGYYFNNRPLLNNEFLKTLNPVARVVAVPDQPHFRADFYFNNKTARILPPHSIPGLTRI